MPDCDNIAMAANRNNIVIDHDELADGVCNSRHSLHSSVRCGFLWVPKHAICDGQPILLVQFKHRHGHNCDICVSNICKELQGAHNAVEDVVEDEEDVQDEYHKESGTKDVRAEEADNNQDKQ